MARGYAFIAAAIGWFAIIGQYFLSNGTKTGSALTDGTIVFFSYFTILSNILVAIALTTASFAPESRLGKFFGGPNGATPVAVYITVTGITYWFLLRPLYADLRGMGMVLNAVHHYVMPVLYVVYWLLFVAKGRLHLRYIPDWLIFPLVYALYTLLHGQASGFYPYPFVDVTKLGLDHVLRDMARFVVFFALVSAAYVLVDRILGRIGRQALPAPAEPSSIKPPAMEAVTGTASTTESAQPTA
jgi:hypothetical protein